MKKILLILLLTIFFIPNVDAEESIIFSVNRDKYDASLATYEAYKTLIDETLAEYADFNDYYAITINEAGDLNDINLIIWDEISTMYYQASNSSILFGATNYKYQIHFYQNKIKYIWDNSNHEHTSWRNLSSLLPDNLVATNYNFYQNFYNNLEIEGIFIDNIILKHGDSFPTLLKLNNYNSWDSYIKNELYTEVNFDNYEYVILSLKDYTKKDAFDTNLQVKGMIGVTPVYEYGTAEKDAVTDRCNVTYSDYTDYRFYILKNDLLSNAVYYVKACEEGSSFKFDNTIFNATYITTETVNDPVITVGGVQYNVIPFDKLSNTANKNEEENFVPGESGSSLTDIIDNTTNYISSFWNSLSTFMSLVTKFFNTLPIEIRAICITTFATACTLGLLKILKS